MPFRLLVKSAAQVACVLKSGEITLYKCGKREMNDIALIKSDHGVSLIADENGRVLFVGSNLDLPDSYGEFDHVIDATNCSVLPGFVDSHTHSCFAGDRLAEFVLKLEGASYIEVHEKGGGIHYTVRCMREAKEEDLLQDLVNRLEMMLKCGTTTVEVKSGYGLDTKTEIKMLQVINRAKQMLAERITVIPTFCGAHAVPQCENADSATSRVINEMLPAIVRANLDISGGIDIFCEKNIFESAHTREILKAGAKVGLSGNFHGDELSCTNSAELGVELKARAVSHLEEISDDGIAALASSAQKGQPTVAVLLPTTAFTLRLKSPPARKMIDAGSCVSLGSDFNPNAYCYNMATVMNLACVIMRMTPNEALVAATLNSAQALGVSEQRGAIAIGRMADLVILDTPKWENLIYQLGCSHELVKYVVKEGKVVYSKK